MRTVSILAVVTIFPLLWSDGAGAVAPSEQGWWFKLNAAPSPLDVPAPPTVPPKGLYVAMDPSGAAAVSAIRVSAPGSAGGTLTLTVADGGAGEPIVAACPGAGWTPAQGGKWEDRAEPECSGVRVVGAVSDDGKTITFQIPAGFGSSAASGLYDIVVLPNDDSALAFQTPFQDGGQFVPLAGFGTVSTVPAAPAAPASGPSDFGGGTGTVTEDPGSVPVDDGGGDTGSVDESTVDTELPAEDTTPATDAGGGEPEQAAPAAEAAEIDDGNERIAAVVLLVLIAAALWWLSTQQARTPQVVGGLAAAGTGGAAAAMAGGAGAATVGARRGGIGRFSRDRIALPNRLA